VTCMLVSTDAKGGPVRKCRNESDRGRGDTVVWESLVDCQACKEVMRRERQRVAIANLAGVPAVC